MRKRNWGIPILILLMIFLFLAISETSKGRTWTAGKYTMEGEFVSLTADGQKVILQKPDGKKMTMDIDRLSPEDQTYIQEQQGEPSVSNDLSALEPGSIAASGDWGEKKGREAGTRQTLTINGLEYAFCWCPSGTFKMGSSTSEEGRENDETQHKVTLSHGFWMLESEVTQEMWESVMGTTVEEQRDNVNKDYPLRGVGSKNPIYYVSWEDCQKFIGKLNSSAPLEMEFRLPSEAQWEYACRAGTTGAYGGSRNLDEMGCTLITAEVRDMK